MGMFDSIYANCPRCGVLCEFQTKAGECFMNSYQLDDAPTELLYDVMNEPHWCSGCKSWFALIDPKYPPGMPPRPNPVPVAVREPVEGEFLVYHHNPDSLRWWNAGFTFADLAQAIEAGTAETVGLGPKDESAVPQGCAQPLSEEQHNA